MRHNQSSLPICAMFFVVDLNCIDEVRAITPRRSGLSGQLGDHLLGQSFAEVVVSLACGEVLEWQDHQHGRSTLLSGAWDADRFTDATNRLAAFRQGLDEALRLRIFAKGFAQQGNVGGEASLLNGRVGPQTLQQFFLW